MLHLCCWDIQRIVRARVAEFVSDSLEQAGVPLVYGGPFYGGILPYGFPSTTPAPSLPANDRTEDPVSENAQVSYSLAIFLKMQQHTSNGATTQLMPVIILLAVVSCKGLFLVLLSIQIAYLCRTQDRQTTRLIK